ncbi:MAG TPA: cytochrome P450 [Pseudonocardiaceae bacterium]
MTSQTHALLPPDRPSRLDDVPAAPGRLPVLGHLWRLARAPLTFIVDLHTDRRTRGGITRIDLGPWSIYVLTDPHLVHEMLVTKGKSFHRGAFFERARSLIGDGLAMLSGEHHLRIRRLVQPAFAHGRMAGYAETVSAQAAELAGSWRAGQVVELDHELDRLFVRTLARVMFSPTLSTTAIDEIVNSLARITKAAIVRVAAPTWLTWLPVGANRSFDRDTRTLHRIVDDIVAQRRRQPSDAHDDLLATLMSAVDADTGAALTDEQVRDQALSILAGVENAGVVVAWAVHALDRHPDIRARVEEELAWLTDGDPDHRFEAAELDSLDYTGRFLREVLRLHAMLLSTRRAVEDVEIGGVLVPAGTELVFSQYGLHRDPVHYPDPLRLDPDRWTPDRIRQSRHDYLPFGAGAQKCIGDVFAWNEMLIVIATIVHRWRLALPTGFTAREALAVVPKPRAMPVVLAPRTPSPSTPTDRL